ncbi:MAG: hypothetical protein IJE04_02325 [Bacilli bacterium]|nr:hypothetical protein [Bacilli bacterium]
MVLNELKERYEKNNEVKFKLFSLEYIIQKNDNGVEVYPLLYSNRKNRYSSLEEALNYYTIYNESIIENIDRVILL